MQLAGKVAIVTGSGQGIGKGIALRFAREGATVVVNARRAETVRATAEEIRQAGGAALEAPADVTAEAEVEGLFARTLEAFDRVDILVNNAQTPLDAGERGPFLKMRAEGWNAYMRANLGALFYCTLGPWGIRVNAIRPGPILVERSPEFSAPRPYPRSDVPLGHAGYPEDVAWAALFLASDEARFVTGQAFEVDGGLLAQGRSPCAEGREIITPANIGEF